MSHHDFELIVHCILYMVYDTIYLPNGLYKNKKFLDASKEFWFCGRKKNHYFSFRIFGKKEREISAYVLRRAPPLFLL